MKLKKRKSSITAYQQIKIISIQDNQHTFCFKCVSTHLSDTFFVISLDKGGNNCISPNAHTSSLSSIKINNQYFLELRKIQTSVTTMQQLGQFIIVANDTLWNEAISKKPPLFYIAENVCGLECWNCTDGEIKGYYEYKDKKGTLFPLKRINKNRLCNR